MPAGVVGVLLVALLVAGGAFVPAPPRDVPPATLALGVYPYGWGGPGAGPDAATLESALRDLRTAPDGRLRPFTRHLYVGWADSPADVSWLPNWIAGEARDGSEVALSLRLVPPASHYDVAARRWRVPEQQIVDDYADWVRRAVTTLRATPAVRWVVVGNEANATNGSPDSDGYYDGGTGIVGRAIARGLVAARGAAPRGWTYPWRHKAPADGTALRLGINYLSDRDFQPAVPPETLLAALVAAQPGFAEALDFVGADSYLIGPRPTLLAEERAALSRGKVPARVALVLTEFGVYRWATRPTPSEDETAGWVADVLRQACRGEGGTVAVWHFPLWGDSIDGLLRADGTRRPAFGAVRAAPCW
jgi:hypothetical protein